MSFNCREAAGTAHQETRTHLKNNHRAEQPRNNQTVGWHTSKEPWFDFKPTTEHMRDAMAEPKKVFVFRAKSPSNQPALPAFTQKETFIFGAEPLPSQSTPDALKPWGASAGVLSASPSRSVTPDRLDRLETHSRQQ